MKKLLAVVLSIAMLFGIASISFAESAKANTPLVVAYSNFSEKFSPFFWETGYDRDAQSITQIGLMTTDRMGGIIYNGIEGETVSYNGKDYTYSGIADLSVNFDKDANITTYTAKLRDDIKFSDGEKLTADDVIFTYYVYLDPAYVGATTLSSYDIIGLKDYRTQTTAEVYEKYAKVAEEILAKGRDYKVAEGDAFTQEQYDDFWALEKGNWEKCVQKIIDQVFAKYVSYAPDYIGVEADKVTDNEKPALAMALWGFGNFDAEAGTLTGGATETVFNLKEGKFPTFEDLFAETFKKYEGNVASFWEAENTGDKSNVMDDINSAFIGYWGPKDEAMGGKGVPNIAGIKKLDDYTVEIKINGYSAPAVYSILGITVAPLHYYGDVAQYNYENNMFGHPFNDLTLAQSKTTKPLGAGPYKFLKYENRVIYYEANENYWEGAPKIKYIQFKETQASEVASALQAGTVDVGELSGTKTNFEMLKGFNSNGELDGDIVHVSKVDNLGYGYIGLNADSVLVGGSPASAESKALRKGIATVLALYRNIAYESYYGEAASVIQYPISNTSWAAPQATDSDYRIAFSVDAEGNDIYTEGMSFEEKEKAALEASISWFKAAGYTFDDATGKFTAAPEGAKLSYEVIIPADGKGDHPSFSVLTYAKEALAKIGIELKINDPSDGNVLWNALDAGTQELWCAAWGATIDPDMYQIYSSNNIVGKGGSDSNHYHIADPELDKAIMDARMSDDQAYRKSVYKTALDLIVDWAVEVPAYQRQNCIIFSNERINLDTMTPDITTFYGWMSELINVEMK